MGGKKWGEFIAVDGVRSGRYLDPPEFSALHDVGNKETVFNRFDYQPDQNDTLHLNLFLARAWFQTPNTYDQQTAGRISGRRIMSYNIAPGWVHILNPHSTVTVNPYVRQDQVHYDPSRNPFADLPATVGESRQSDECRRQGRLRLRQPPQQFQSGHAGSAHVSRRELLPRNHAAGLCREQRIVRDSRLTISPTAAICSRFAGHTDIKEYALYAQDNLTFGGLNIQAGLRADFYRGITAGHSLEPRLGYFLSLQADEHRASHFVFEILRDAL